MTAHTADDCMNLPQGRLSAWSAASATIVAVSGAENATIHSAGKLVSVQLIVGPLRCSAHLQAVTLLPVVPALLAARSD
jgi:hypothetical protein